MANPTRATAVRISAELYTTSSSPTNRRWIITARPRFTCRHPCLRFAANRFWAAPSGAALFCSPNRMGGFYGRIDEEERSEEHTPELQSLMSNTYAVFSLNNKQKPTKTNY